MLNKYDIVVDNYLFTVEVLDFIDTPPNHSTWDSDWDYYGELSVSFNIISVLDLDTKEEMNPTIFLEDDYCLSLIEDKLIKKIKFDKHQNMT